MAFRLLAWSLSNPGAAAASAGRWYISDIRQKCSREQSITAGAVCGASFMELSLVGVWETSLMVKSPCVMSPFSVAVLCVRSPAVAECRSPGGSWAGTPWSHSLSLPLGGGFPPFPPQGWESHWTGICSSPLHCPSSFRCQPPVFWSHKGNQLHACHAGSFTAAPMENQASSSWV